MSVEILCPSGHRLQVMPDQVGQRVRCPTCQQVFVVPDQIPGAAVPPAFKQEDLAGLKMPTEDQPRPPRQPRGGMSMPNLDVFSRGRQIAQPLLLLGLVIVLTSRGCEALSARSAAITQNEAAQAEQKFNDRYDANAVRIQDRMDTLRKKKVGDRSDSETKELDEAQKQLDNLAKDKEEERHELEKTKWRDLKIAARDANANNMASGWWRDATFLVGTIVLSIGLLLVGFNGQGPERWICLIMLAIITFSIYVSGTLH